MKITPHPGEAMKVTAKTITDEQIRRLRHETSYFWADAELVLDDRAQFSSYEPQRTVRLQAAARTRLADAWNDRHAINASATEKGSGQVEYCVYCGSGIPASDAPRSTLLLGSYPSSPSECCETQARGSKP